MRRLRILQVLVPALNPNAGGVQMTTNKLDRYFSEQGHQSAIFSFACDGHKPGPGVNLYHSKETGGPLDMQNLAGLGNTLDEFRPEVVINHMPYEHGLTRFLAGNKRYLLLGCLRNTLFSVKLNIDAYLENILPRPFQLLARNQFSQTIAQIWHRNRHQRDLLRILDRHDYFILFGPPNLNELRYFLPSAPEDKIRFVPNSIPEVVAEVPAKEKKILWLGRIDKKQKRVNLVIDLWARLFARLPDWHLDIVGDGPFLEEMRAEVESKNLQRIEFFGQQVPDPYYDRASIFLMTSAFEGFPNTLIEAQSRGAIPVIFDSYPVASWVVDDGVNGFLIPPFNLDAMADRVVCIAEDAERSSFAEAALENAQRFHIDTVGKQWEALFEKELGMSGDDDEGHGHVARELLN